jgi:hypothetical protein
MEEEVALDRSGMKLCRLGFCCSPSDCPAFAAAAGVVEVPSVAVLQLPSKLASAADMWTDVGVAWLAGESDGSCLIFSRCLYSLSPIFFLLGGAMPSWDFSVGAFVLFASADLSTVVEEAGERASDLI